MVAQGHDCKPPFNNNDECEKYVDQLLDGPLVDSSDGSHKVPGITVKSIMKRAIDKKCPTYVGCTGEDDCANVVTAMEFCAFFGRERTSRYDKTSGKMLYIPNIPVLTWKKDGVGYKENVNRTYNHPTNTKKPSYIIQLSQIRNQADASVIVVFESLSPYDVRMVEDEIQRRYMKVDRGIRLWKGVDNGWKNGPRTGFGDSDTISNPKLFKVFISFFPGFTNRTDIQTNY
eukprot:CAMPEP_0170855992 /NCGR_PEP_ID=MMETSP0734-20130129/14288_1 /TAXON_ID=186038 /ORGANISM="Fragilariopsis kerguelensis, Strain L26-C5" /LENGTH=229 /DNA_ID=CAMNT_0011227667 /DNA_START=15 /DNA_END=704 /DNA_ORIENTATION=+